MSTVRKRIFLIVNLYLVVSTSVITISNLTSAGQADSHISGFRGIENLMYYTVDSNILMSLCAVILLIFVLCGKKSLPYWLHMLTMMAAVSVGVTFATVAFFLSPGQALAGRGYFSLFTRNNLYFHLINPLLGCADFIWLIPHRRFSLPQCLWGILPTAVYGTVYAICVVGLGTWPDIYNFTFGGHNKVAPLVILIMLALAFGIALFLTRLHNRAGTRKIGKEA